VNLRHQILDLSHFLDHRVIVVSVRASPVPLGIQTVARLLLHRARRQK
jgi:hypothetical protein